MWFRRPFAIAALPRGTVFLTGPARLGAGALGHGTFLLGLGAFLGIVTLGAALKANNIGATIEVVEASSWTGVVGGTVGKAWAIGTIEWSGCKVGMWGWTISWPWSRRESTGLLAA